ncbi:hypothetical protein HDU98_000704 [Podochytrium sp. JEL0797]|nr:hypothetical protein HDU98_000704 [Podochytrium sp. JEL0797]
MFSLSQFRESDITDLHAMLQDPVIHQNTLVLPNPYTEADAAWFVNDCIENHKKWQIDGKGKHPLQQCIRSADGKVIGNIDLVYCPGSAMHPAMARIGYYLHSEFRGKSIMAEAIKQMLEHAFSDAWDIERVEGATFAWNKSSGRALEKAGFRFEGRKNGYHRKRGVEGLIDAHGYGLTKSEWEMQRKNK